jgi:shikimate dehydrogenase
MSAQATKIYGLIGFPVSHSISPLMHNAAFKELGLDATYKLFEVKPENLTQMVGSLSEDNIYGLNVTIPHKEKVIPLLDEISQEARLIGAVNTIRRMGNRLEGFNTDGQGFLRHLTMDLQFNPSGSTIAILGAGGAAKAVSVVLSKASPGRIAIYDVDKIKAAALIEQLSGHFRNVEFIYAAAIEDLRISEADLLVNATPIGMKKSDPCLVDENLLHKGILVYDVIYNPKETLLLARARARGAQVANGLGMLLYQGVAAFEIWTGNTAPVEVMRKALEEGARSL